METFQSIKDLKNKYLTTDYLYKELEKNGFSANFHAIKRWEKALIIPAPKRVLFKKKEWRVYTLEDIKEIISNLIKVSSIRRVNRIKK